MATTAASTRQTVGWRTSVTVFQMSMTRGWCAVAAFRLFKTQISAEWAHAAWDSTAMIVMAKAMPAPSAVAARWVVADFVVSARP
jgi:hypothetical protein